MNRLVLIVLLIVVLIGFATTVLVFYPELEAGVAALWGQREPPAAGSDGIAAWGYSLGLAKTLLLVMAAVGVVAGYRGMYVPTYDWRLAQRVHPREAARDALLVGVVMILGWLIWICVLAFKYIPLGLALAICISYCVVCACFGICLAWRAGEKRAAQ